MRDSNTFKFHIHNGGKMTMFMEHRIINLFNGIKNMPSGKLLQIRAEEKKNL